MLFDNSCNSAMELLLVLVRFLLEISSLVKKGTNNLYWPLENLERVLIILAKSFSTYSPGTLRNPLGICTGNSFYSLRIL